MKIQSVYILLSLTVLIACKVGQNHSFTKTKKKKQVTLAGALRPHVVFALQNGDTLKFNSRDIYSMLDNNIRQQVKIESYLTNQAWQTLANIMKNQKRDTLIFQNLSAVSDKTLSGVLDTWVARELLLKGHAIVVLKNQTNILKRLKYIFLFNKLGGQQGNFYAEDNKLVYRTIIALGE